MKILLTTLNSKYIQTNLALRYLYEAAYEYQQYIQLKEFTINQEESYIYNEIIRDNYDIICISSYIWNTTKVMDLVSNIKKVRNTIVILGGPEVSFDSEELIIRHPYIDYIIRGEGEKTFYNILRWLVSKKGCRDEIKGITFLSGNHTISTPDNAPVQNLDDLPFPYKHFEPEKDRIIYYETSRGCCFNCSYCLSSVDKGVRYFPLDRVKAELMYFIKKEVAQVKFVDRTFNVNTERCLEIIKHIKKIDRGKTNFHFEINGDLLNQDILNELRNARKDLFQLEIGVQSTSKKVLYAVNRKTDFQKLSRNVQIIRNYNNVHLHLDLIAGLPFEDYNTFKKSFNDVFSLNPHNLQLGFLKLLKGSRIRQEASTHLYCFREKEPYEILSNKYITATELVKLKMIEDILEKYFNRSRFKATLKFMIDNCFDDPFSFFNELAEYWWEKGHHHISQSRDSLYWILSDFYTNKGFSDTAVFSELLRYDRMLNSAEERSDNAIDKAKIHAILHNENFRNKYIPHYSHLKAKDLKKIFGYRAFGYNIHAYVTQNKEIINEKNLCFFDYSDKCIQGLALVYCLPIKMIEEVKHWTG